MSAEQTDWPPQKRPNERLSGLADNGLLYASLAIDHAAVGIAFLHLMEWQAAADDVSICENMRDGTDRERTKARARVERKGEGKVAPVDLGEGRGGGN